MSYPQTSVPWYFFLKILLCTMTFLAGEVCRIFVGCLYFYVSRGAKKGLRYYQLTLLLTLGSPSHHIKCSFPSLLTLVTSANTFLANGQLAVTSYSSSHSCSSTQIQLSNTYFLHVFSISILLHYLVQIPIHH